MLFWFLLIFAVVSLAHGWSVQVMSRNFPIATICSARYSKQLSQTTFPKTSLTAVSGSLQKQKKSKPWAYPWNRLYSTTSSYGSGSDETIASQPPAFRTTLHRSNNPHDRKFLASLANSGASSGGSNIASAHSTFSLSHDSPMLLIGSCFSEHIYNRLQALKFTTIYSNPQGILFNPLSITKCLSRLTKKVRVIDETIFQSKQDQLYYSWDHHSDFCSIESAKDLHDQIIQEDTNALKVLYSDHPVTVFITLGSAKVFALKEELIRNQGKTQASQLAAWTSAAVANCHKQPIDLFESRILSTAEITSSLGTALKEIFHSNPLARVIFTVSPVRHSRDGLVNNMKSKAALISAIHELIDQFSREKVNYFPSYEIMMDDLRDYRWYESDMIHPNEQAVNYIFDIFSQIFFSNETRQLNAEIQRIQANIHHRVRFPQSIAYKKHLETTHRAICDLQRKLSLSSNPVLVSFDDEKAELERRLTQFN